MDIREDGLNRLTDLHVWNNWSASNNETFDCDQLVDVCDGTTVFSTVPLVNCT